MSLSEILLPLHLITLGYIAWNVIRADIMATKWIRGVVVRLDATVVARYHRATWIGLIVMITTGVLMFLPRQEYLFDRAQFWIKMAFVLTLVVNAFVIGRLQHIATTYSYKDLTFRQRLPLFLSGAVSTIAWIGAASTAFFLVESF